MKVEDLEIEPVYVDHSVPGAYGFIIHTSKGSIVYSSDYRLHGPMGHMTRELVNKACESDPVAIISEGTHICPEESQVTHSESKVKAESNEVVANTFQLVIVAFYMHMHASRGHMMFFNHSSSCLSSAIPRNRVMGTCV